MYARSTVLDALFVLWQELVEDMTLPLDGEPEGLDEGGEEADNDAYGDGDCTVYHGGRNACR